jgi:hypothetical protein
MAAHTNWSLADFMKAVKNQVVFKGKVEVKVIGLDRWEVREGFLYTVTETRQITIHLYGTNGRKHDLKIEGNRSVEDVKEFMGQR